MNSGALVVGLALLVATAGTAAAQRAISRPPPARPAPPPAAAAPVPATADWTLPARSRASEGVHADSVRFGIVPRASGFTLGLGLQANRPVKLPGGDVSWPRLCFECRADSLAIRLEIPFLPAVEAPVAERLRFRFETENRRPFYIAWLPDADPGVFVTSGLPWWQGRLRGEKRLRIDPPGALGIGGDVEFSIAGFEAAVRRARTTCAWSDSLVASGTARPDSRPTILSESLSRHFLEDLKPRRDDPFVVLCAVIDSLGHVQAAWPYLSYPALDADAERRLRGATILPAGSAGTPATVPVIVPFRYSR